MSDTPVPIENGDGSAPVPDLKISEIVDLLRQIGEIARHAVGTRDLDWTPRGVLKMFHLVIRANMRLRDKLEELKRELGKQEEIAKASRIAMNEALTFFTNETAKLALSPEDRQRINEHVSSARATIFPEAETTCDTQSSPASQPKDPVATETDEGVGRITQELFLELESPSVQANK